MSVIASVIEREELLNKKFEIFQVTQRCERVEGGISEFLKLNDILLALAAYHLAIVDMGDDVVSSPYYQVASGFADCLGRGDEAEDLNLSINPILYFFMPARSEWVIFFTKDQPSIPFVFFFGGLVISKMTPEQMNGFMALWKDPTEGQTIDQEIIDYLNGCDLLEMPPAE